MRSFLTVLIGLILVITPGGVSLVLCLAMILPKHRQFILTKVKSLKGDVKMALEKIIAKRNPGKDEDLVKFIHRKTNELDRIDESRKLAVDNATLYLDEKNAEKGVAKGPALIISIFFLGCLATGSIWFATTYLPFKGF